LREADGVTTVVTGAAGHIGGNLVRELVARGRSVRALVHRDRRALQGVPLELVNGDVRDLASLRRAFDGADVVYHMAAQISLLDREEALLRSVNVSGTRNVVQACLDCGVRRLVHFSSIHAVRQAPLDEPIDESRALVDSRRYPLYDRTKAAGEMVVSEGLAHGLDAIIVSPTGVIGPHDYRPSHFGQALLSLARGNMPALVTGGFDWVDVRDVVHYALVAEEQAATGVKYLLSGHWVSIVDLARAVSELREHRVPKLVCPMAIARAVAPINVLYARVRRQRPTFTPAMLRALRSNRDISHQRASRDLGYEPRPFRETVADTVRWFELAGFLP
jgi:dihydroflavonol-4-reductase